MLCIWFCTVGCSVRLARRGLAAVGTPLSVCQPGMAGLADAAARTMGDGASYNQQHKDAGTGCLWAPMSRGPMMTGWHRQLKGFKHLNTCITGARAT